MKIVLIFLLILPAYLQAETPAFLLLGQSNCSGRWSKSIELSEINRLMQPSKIVSSGDRNVPSFSNIFPANMGDTSKGDFGVEVGVANYLSQHTIQPWYIIKHAQGGTSISEDWLAGSNHLQTSFNLIDSAILQKPDLSIKGLVWVQGERDAQKESRASVYKTKLQELISLVRTKAGNANLPVIITRTHRFNTTAFSEPGNGNYIEWIRQAQEDVASLDSNTYLITSDDIPLNDAIHYTSKGLVTLGERAAEAYIKQRNITTMWEVAGFYDAPTIPDPVPIPTEPAPNPEPTPTPAPTLKTVAPYDSIIAYYDFGGSGSGIRDLKSQYSATMINMDPATDRVLVSNENAINFDGANDYLQVTGNYTFSDSDSFSIVTRCTIEGLPTATSGQHVFLAFSNAANTPGRVFARYTGSDLQFQAISDDGQVTTCSSSQTLANGQVYHLAFVLDRSSSSLLIYVNGSQVASQTLATASGFTTINNTTIGTLINNAHLEGKYALNGSMLNLSVWRIALTPSQISSLHTNPTQVFAE